MSANIETWTHTTYTKAARELRAHAKRGRGGERKKISYETSQICALLFGGDHFGDSPCQVCLARAKACDAIAFALKKYGGSHG